jgi:hypothetical protein
MRAGSRVQCWIRAPGAADPVWSWTTIGCVARAADHARYLVTARHSLGDAYGPPPYDLAECRLSVVADSQRYECPSVVRPAQAVNDELVVDVVGINVPGDVLPASDLACEVPQLGDIDAFEGQPGFILVERDGNPKPLTGTISVLPGNQVWWIVHQGQRYPVKLPPLVRLDFDDPDWSTIAGDSGAPVLSSALGASALLGFHFFEAHEDGNAGRPYSLATAACWFLNATYLQAV